MATSSTETTVKRKNNIRNIKHDNKKRKTQQKTTAKIKRQDIKKWKFLEHKGPFFPQQYQPLPSNLFSYNSKKMKLCPKSEEVATLYAKMLNSKCAEEKIFQENFFKDWRKVMTRSERTTINDLAKCDFTVLQEYLQNHKKSKHDASIKKEYGFCNMNGETIEIIGFKMQGPVLFVGKGGHPKMGMLKPGITPEDVTINCSKDSKIPAPPNGHKWKKVIHVTTVRWLAKWYDDVAGGERYMLAKSIPVKRKQQNQKQKQSQKNVFVNTQQARKAKEHDIQQMFEILQSLQYQFKGAKVRYLNDLDSPSVQTSQSAVALYLVDHFGFRTDDNIQDNPDHMGCCAIGVRDVQLHKEKNNQQNVVVFTSSGKVLNEISVNDKVFRNLEYFQALLTPEDKLFDRLTPSKLNNYLNCKLYNLTDQRLKAYNGSVVFELLLQLFTQIYRGFSSKKIECYECANLAVAIFFNHRKSFANRDPVLEEKIAKLNHDLRSLVRQIISTGNTYNQSHFEIMLKGTAVLRSLQDILKLNDYDLLTSRYKYMDPRITVAWSLNNGVSIDKIFTKQIQEKFAWAIATKKSNFRFFDCNL